MEHRLARLTRAELAARAGARAVGVVPVGSLEQHGDHLPVFTDSLLVEAICIRAAEHATADVLVAPVIWTGFSPHHLRFGGTVTLDGTTFLALVRDVVRSIRTWLPHLVLVNGHGGNRGPLVTLAIEEHVAMVNYWELVPPSLTGELFPSDRGSVGHAGELETSAMLAVAPDLVGTPGSAHEPILADGEAFLVPDLGVSGVLGDPRAASAEAGASFVDVVAKALAHHLDTLSERKEHLA